VTEAATPKSASIKVSPEPPGEPSTISGPCLQIGYSHGFYGQYPPVLPTKQEDVPACVPSPQPYFLPSIQHAQPHLQHITDPESNHGYPLHGFYPTPMLPPIYHHPHYPILRPDNAPLQLPDAYPLYPLPVYPKQPMGGQHEMAHDPRNETSEISVIDRSL